MIAARVEEPLVRRVRIRAADELDRDEIMRRNHSCVVGMKLVPKTLFHEPLTDGINTVCDDERRPLDLLG